MDMGWDYLIKYSSLKGEKKEKGGKRKQNLANVSNIQTDRAWMVPGTAKNTTASLSF